MIHKEASMNLIRLIDSRAGHFSRRESEMTAFDGVVADPDPDADR